MAQSSDRRWTKALTERADIHRVLIIKWSAMGDVALASAAFEDIRGAFPDARLDLSILPPWDRLFRHDRRFTKLVVVNARRRKNRWRAQFEWLRAVAAGNYDLVIDLQSTDHTRTLLAMLWLVGGDIRFKLGHHRHFPYNIAPPVMDAHTHALAVSRAALAAGGIASKTDRPILQIPEHSRQAAERLLMKSGITNKRYAVFLPGCQRAGYLKRWGAEYYAALATAVCPQLVDRVLLPGGPDDIEECARIAHLAGECVVDLPATGILDLVPICAAARFVVANDTGTAHAAAAAGTPMVVICGPTDPKRVRPLGPQVRTLQADLSCVNCYLKHCEHHRCMRMIEPRLVHELLCELLAEDSSGSPSGRDAIDWRVRRDASGGSRLAP